MDWKNLIVCLCLLVYVESSDYCMYDSFKPSQSIAVSSCELVQTGQTLAKQCELDDLATMVYPVQLDHKIFWLQKGDLCTTTTCEALVLNSSDQLAPTSIFCLPCDDLNDFVCNSNGSPCVPATAATSASYSTACNETWTRRGNRIFLISNVRRTLGSCTEWCQITKNGSSSINEGDLKLVESVTIPDPDVGFYWVSASVHAHSMVRLGTVLSTKTSRGTTFTQTFKIFDVGNGEKSNMYGCICIKKDKDYATTTSTTTSTTSTTQSTSSTVTSTPSTSTVTTTQTSTTTTTHRSLQPGDVLSGKYKNIQAYNGLMKKLGVLDKICAKRSAECAMMCDRTSGCNGYFYDKMTTICQLVDGANLNQDCDTVSTAKYYQRQ